MTHINPKVLRDNYLRTVEMRYPSFIPCNAYALQAAWAKYREKLEEIFLHHPVLFPNFKKGMTKFDNFGIRRKGNVYVDEWGCVWKFLKDGLQGQVIKHPLDSWSKLKNLRIPDPEKGLPTEGGPPRSWESIKESVKKAREKCALVVVSVSHGFFFQRLYYLRGFTNLMMDFLKEPPELWELIDLLTEYNLELVKRILKMKVDLITFGDDLGLQDRMPVSPETFKKFISPTYKRIFLLIRSRNVHVYLHTDGHVVEVIDQLIESGVSVLNIQDMVNGIENIKRLCKGKVCIDLDIDRQHLLPFGKPKDIERHVDHVVRELASRKGGLMLKAEIGPDVPLENVEAICKAFEKNRKKHLELPD